MSYNKEGTMGRKNGEKNEETLRIRMSTDLLRRIQAAKVPAGWGEEADSSFARHLLIIGIDEVEWIIGQRNNRQDFEAKKGKPAQLDKKASSE